MRILFVVLALALAGLLTVDLEPSASSRAAVAVPARGVTPKPAPETVDVAFVRNGWIVRVQRVVPRGAKPAEVALRELTGGFRDGRPVEGDATFSDGRECLATGKAAAIGNSTQE